jgi:hypothetical protein
MAASVLHSKSTSDAAEKQMSFRVLASFVSAAFVAATLHAAAPVSRQQSDAFARKLALITRHADIAPPPAAGQRTQVSEGELNSWFAFRSQKYLPAGVAPPTMSIIGNGKVMGDVTLDLEAYAKGRKSGGTLDPWSLLGGRVPITVTGILHTKDGRGRFELQSADLSGIPLPKVFLQELVSYYSRTPDKPQGIRLDDPFELPASIRHIEVGQGQAVVVQ